MRKKQFNGKANRQNNCEAHTVDTRNRRPGPEKIR